MVDLTVSPVKLAETSAELQNIYRFRYKVYTDEMDFHFPWANKEERLLQDPIDGQSLNFYVKNRQDEIVGVIRLVIFSDQSAPEGIIKKYHTHHFSEEFEGTNRIMISRFLVREDYRLHSKAAWKLIQECYHQCERNLAPLVFIDCSPHLVKFYEALGFRRYAPNFTDDVLGYKVPMVILLQDVDYLRKVSSPLYIFARKRRDARNLDDWYKTVFPRFNDSMFTGQFGAEKLMANLTAHASTLPSTFHKISQKLKTSCLIDCRKGDYVIRQGEMGNEMYMILSGAFEVQFSAQENKTESLGILGPGDVFGELGFLVRSPRTSSLVALEDSQLLMIAADKVEQIVDMHPKESAELFLDLIKLMAQRFVDRYQTV